jgi:hypothetical protein
MRDGPRHDRFHVIAIEATRTQRLARCGDVRRNQVGARGEITMSNPNHLPNSIIVTCSYTHARADTRLEHDRGAGTCVRPFAVWFIFRDQRVREHGRRGSMRPRRESTRADARARPLTHEHAWWMREHACNEQPHTREHAYTADISTSDHAATASRTNQARTVKLPRCPAQPKSDNVCEIAFCITRARCANGVVVTGSYRTRARTCVRTCRRT